MTMMMVIKYNHVIIYISYETDIQWRFLQLEKVVIILRRLNNTSSRDARKPTCINIIREI